MAEAVTSYPVHYHFENERLKPRLKEKALISWGGEAGPPPGRGDFWRGLRTGLPHPDLLLLRVRAEAPPSGHG